MEGRFDNKTAVPQEIVRESPRSSSVVDTWMGMNTAGEYTEGVQYANGKIILTRTNVKRNKNPFVRAKRKVQIIEYQYGNIDNKTIIYLTDLNKAIAFMEKAQRMHDRSKSGGRMK